MSRFLRLVFTGACLVSCLLAGATLVTWYRSYQQLESAFYVYNSPRSPGSGAAGSNRTAGVGRISWFGGELHLSWDHRTGLTAHEKWLSGASTGFEWSQYPVRLITWPGEPIAPRPQFPRPEFGYAHESGAGRWKFEISTPQWFLLCLTLLLPGVWTVMRGRHLIMERRRRAEANSASDGEKAE